MGADLSTDKSRFWLTTTINYLLDNGNEQKGYHLYVKNDFTVYDVQLLYFISPCWRLCFLIQKQFIIFNTLETQNVPVTCHNNCVCVKKITILFLRCLTWIYYVTKSPFINYKTQNSKMKQNQKIKTLRHVTKLLLVVLHFVWKFFRTKRNPNKKKRLFVLNFLSS